MDKIKYAQCKDVKIDVDGKNRTVTATISTIGVDRDKEVLIPKGAVLTNFRKNPIVPWAHKYDQPPIGKALWIRKTEDAIIAKTEFAEHEFAEEIWQLYKNKFLKGFSVGFDPDFKSMRRPTDDDIKNNPEWKAASLIIPKWELLEYSAAPIPVNPEALVTAIGKGLKVSDETQELLGIAVCEIEKSETDLINEEKEKLRAELAEQREKRKAEVAMPKVMIVKPRILVAKRVFKVKKKKIDTQEIISNQIKNVIDQQRGIV